MRLRSYRATMLRFFALFLGGAALVLIWVTLESYYIKRLSFEYLMRFSIPATLVLLFGMVLSLMILVGVRLIRMKNRGFETDNIEYSEQVSTQLLLLLKLPNQIFWGTIVYGGIFIPVYHVVHYIVEGHSITNVDEYYRLNFLRSFLYEQTITLIAAIFHFAVARRLIRPMLLKLEYSEDLNRQFKSFLSMLTATFAGLLLVLQFSILWYIMVTIVKGEPFELSVLIGLVILDLLFAVAIFILLSYQFRRELMILIKRIRDWLNDEQAQIRGQAPSLLPILSHDEVGQLAMSFNRLQAQVYREYEELEQEMRLAKQVQEQLMPNLDQLSIADQLEFIGSAEEEQAFVSNTFYDVIAWEHGYIAVIGSSELLGIPAALHISAAQLLLRAELDVVGEQLWMLELDELLTQFDQRLEKMFLHQDREPQTGLLSQAKRLTLAMVVVHEHQQRLRYATLGEHAAIWSKLHGVMNMQSPPSELNWRTGERVCLSSVDTRHTVLSITHHTGGGAR